MYIKRQIKVITEIINAIVYCVITLSMHNINVSCHVMLKYT